jgi:hypothetical protein
MLSVTDCDCKHCFFFLGMNFAHPGCVWMFLLCILITDRAHRLVGALPVARGEGVLPLGRASELGDEWKPEKLAGVVVVLISYIAPLPYGT